MIAWLVGLGLGKRAAQAVAFVILPLLVLGAFYLAFDAYGDARYDAGKVAADDAWAEAARQLELESIAAAAQADKSADLRAVEFADRLEAEKEKIDAAIADGGDPFDVLFPGGVQDDSRVRSPETGSVAP